VKPLEDVRIIALEQYGAGPFATMHLADLGAEIIKIEDPGVIGQPELADDARFVDFAARYANAGELLSILRECFLTRSVDEWLELLQDAGVPSGPIQDLPAALSDPHTLARGLLVETQHPTHGTVRQPVTPVKVGEHPNASSMSCGPALGADVPQVLRDLLGYDAARLSQLQATGALVTT